MGGYDKTTIDGVIAYKLATRKNRDVRKGLLQPQIKFSEAKDLLIRNDFRCFYCNFKCKSHGFEQYDKDQYTFERIDNSIAHTKENVIIACYSCNCTRNKRSFLDFYVHMLFAFR